jgi:hypothetical protein
MVAGAVTTGIIDGVIEAIYTSNPDQWAGKFPFVKTVDPLPPADDWIVLAIPLLAYGIGKWRKSETAEDFGLGGLLYAGPMFIHHIIVRAAAKAAGRL